MTDKHSSLLTLIPRKLLVFGKNHKILQNLILLAIYFATAKLGLKLGAVSGFATLVWPPTGIALAALIIFGNHLWPGIALGAFLVNWAVGAPAPVALGMCVGNTLEAVTGAYLLRRAGFHPSLERLRWVFSLIMLAAILGTPISATLGVTSLWLSGTLTDTYGSTWLAWWFGDVMGDLVVAPFLLVWSTGVRFRNEPRRILEAIAISALVVLGSLLIFSDLAATGSGDSAFPRPYLTFPILILVAVRLGQAGVVTSVLAISAIAIGTTATGHGRFWTGSLSASLLEAQLFLGILTSVSMVLAAAMSEGKREQRALERSNAQREAILDSALDCIVTIDHQGNIVEFNPAAEKTFGYKRDEVIGKEMAELIIPERLREAHRRGLARYLATGEGPVLGHRLEMPAMRANGTEFPVELSILALKNERPPMFTGFIQDITARKLAEESQKFLAEGTKILSASIDYETTLKRVAQAALPGLGDWCIVQIIGEDGNVQSVELACASPEKDALIRPHLSRYLTDLNSPTLTSSVIRTKQARVITHFSEEIYRPLGADQELLRVVGQLGIQSVMISPLSLHEQVLGAISLVSANPSRRYGQKELDVFEELARRAAIAIKNARLYREAQEAIMARDEFLSIASHELKTPLTSLSLQLQMFNKGLQRSFPEQGTEAKEPDVVPVPMRLAKSVGACEVQSRKIAALLDELLDLTRIRLGRLQLERETVDLCSLVSEVAERSSVEAAQKGTTVSVRCVLPTMGAWDRVRIEQVVTNLLSNAIKYGEGKPVLVTVDQDENHLKARLVVQDQGMGVPPGMREKIFERFERAGVSGRKIAGLGLGLYITRQIVDAHGGTIRVESAAGKGSTFTVEIPLGLASAGGLTRSAPTAGDADEKSTG